MTVRNPRHWGSNAWYFLHCVTLCYPNRPTMDEKKRYREFFLSTMRVLPCARCRVSMQAHLREDPLTDRVLSRRGSLVRWLVRIHNRVNRALGKPELTYREAMAVHANCSPPSST